MKAGTLNPLAVQVMNEIGIDISQNKPKDIFPFIREQPGYSYVISVRDQSVGQHCPGFPAGVRQIEWSFPDPATFTGTEEEKLARTREVRDAIKTRIEAWCDEMCAHASVT